VITEISSWKEDKRKENYLPIIKEIIPFGLTLTIILAIGVILRYTDRIMINYFLENPLPQIAIYSIGMGLAGLLLLFSAPIIDIVGPTITQLYGENKKDEMKKILSVSMKMITLAILPLTIVLIIFSKELLVLFYGANYSEGWGVLILFSLALSVQALSWAPMVIFSAIKRLDINLKIGAVAAFTNVILNYLLIGKYGINGAAFASLISFVISFILALYYSKKIFGFNPKLETYKPIFSGLVTIFILFLTKDYLMQIINGIIPLIKIGISQGQLADEIAQKLVKLFMFGCLFLFSSGIYLISIILTKTLGKDEKKLLNQILIKLKIPKKYLEKIDRVI